MKKIEEKFNKIILLEMGFSILFMILGIIMFMYSEIANSIAGTLIGIFFLIAGIIQIYTFIDKSKIKLFRYNIFIGLLDIILGIFIMINPLLLVNILNISLGIWIIVEGLSKFILFYNLKMVKEESNKIFLVSTLLFIFMGVVLIINPFISLVITKIIGIFLILSNIVNISDLVLLKRRSKKFLKLFK